MPMLPPGILLGFQKNVSPFGIAVWFGYREHIYECNIYSFLSYLIITRKLNEA